MRAGSRGSAGSGGGSRSGGGSTGRTGTSSGRSSGSTTMVLDRPGSVAVATPKGYRASAPTTSCHHARSPAVVALRRRRRANACSSGAGPIASSGPLTA